MKKINNTFTKIEELRGAIIRRHMDNPQAVLFINDKAAEQMPENSIFLENGIWKKWPRVIAVKYNEEIHHFEKTDDGDEMFFYELDS